MLTVDQMIKQKDYLADGVQYIVEMYYGAPSPVDLPRFHIKVFNVMGDYPILVNIRSSESRWEIEAIYSNPLVGAF
jgi:hypothetical protein